MIFKWLKFQNYRLRTKLIVSYVLLTVIPMSLLGFIAYSQYTNSIEEQVGEYIPKLLEQANENIENQLEEIRQLPDLLYNSSQVIGVLRKDAHQNQSLLRQDQFIVNSYLSRTYINGSNPDILGVFILSKNRIYESVKVPYSNFKLEGQTLPYGQNLDFQGKEEMIILPHQTTLQFEENRPYILLMRQLTDFENRTNLGTIFIAVDVTFLKSVITKLNVDNKADLWMVDETGRIIYHTNEKLIGTVDEEFISYPKINGSFRTKAEENNRLISLNQLSHSQWTLVHSVLVKNLTGKTDLVRNVTIIVFIFFVVISTGISIVVAMNVSSPINQLMRRMKKVEKGNFDVDLSVNTKEEVGMLSNSFNSMVFEIRKLIREKYQIELKQKEAELYALQAQINPHFMYNTLETIAMAVEDDEKDTVVEMVTLLGRMLRFSISNKDSFVPISKELLHTQDYLTIQKIRFEDKVDFTIQTINYLIKHTPRLSSEVLTIQDTAQVLQKTGNFAELQTEIGKWISSVYKTLTLIDQEKVLHQVDVAKEWIMNNLKENITIEKIARQVYMNPTYFCEYFKNQKVYEISEQVGYADTKYFSKLFKKYYGELPSKYKEKLSAK
jgi:two-component system, sensor histidine kinase YesM